MNNARYYYAASILSNGKVLVTGGSNGMAINSAELYDPSTGTCTITDKTIDARQWHKSSVLINGKVTRTWTITGTMNHARYWHTAAAL